MTQTALRATVEVFTSAEPSVEETGALTPVVVAAGWAISSAVVIGATWRGRSHWEPAEEDVDKGPSKVGGLICAVALALMWVSLGSDEHRTELNIIALSCAAVCLVGLLAYVWLINTHIYERVVATGRNESKSFKIIGGFALTEPAKKQLKSDETMSVQKLLRGAAYDPDLIWPRPSRAWAKLAFIAAYLGLTIGGTIALSAAAIVLAV